MLRRRKNEKIEDPVGADFTEEELAPQELPPEPDLEKRRKQFPIYPDRRQVPPARRMPVRQQAPPFSAIGKADELFEECFAQEDPEWELEQVMLRLNYNIRRSIK